MRIRPVLLFVLAIAAVGCKDNTVTVYVHDQGTYKGKVAQYAVDGSLAADQSGATVTIAGTSLKGTTDANGEFQIINVPAGIYNLTFTKVNYDSATLIGDKFTGAGTIFLPDHQIQAIPYDSIEVLSAIWRIDSINPVTQGNKTYIDTVHALDLTIKVIGPDSVTLPFAEIGISKDRANGDTTWLNDGTIELLNKNRITLHSGKRYSGLEYALGALRQGDVINVSLQAITRGPRNQEWNALVSPYQTHRKLVLK